MVTCCSATHEWTMLWEKRNGSFFVNRRCRRCGSLQSGDYDPLTRYITWNTRNELSEVAREPVGSQLAG